MNNRMEGNCHPEMRQRARDFMEGYEKAVTML
jgi:hypothetical protein